jgi:putative phosphotransacetylase
MSKFVRVGISARHVHLAREHVDILFGLGHQLQPLKYVYQPGQYAAEETVDIVSAKTTFKNVRVLGPERSQTQVEISLTDAMKLGISAPIRDSGDIKGSPGITLVGPKGMVVLPKGVIVAWRHIHMNPEDAAEMGVKDRELIQVRCNNPQRSVIFEKVLVRVHESFLLEAHIDTDEANAAMLSNADLIEILKLK